MIDVAPLLADLTDDQRAAVQHGEGPLLILAAAGSGKTRVITRRVAHLLATGVPARNVLAITFTNKAAGEMKARVEKLVPGNQVWVSTFHSLGARLLRMYGERLGFDRNFTIYDTDDRAKVVKDALDATGIDNVKFSPERIASEISKAKNQLITPPQYERTATDFMRQVVAKVYHGYEKRLRMANAMDFDDLLYLPARALRENEELRRDLDARFKYVLIDEYQDTNMAQYEIAKRLSIDHPNLCVVGDPDQCVPAGTLIHTPRGLRPVETIREGDEVLSCAGFGKVLSKRVSKVMVNPHRATLMKVTLSNGAELRATFNHVCFARMPDDPRDAERRPVFVVPAHEADAARFHGWEDEPLPDMTSYATGLIDRAEFEDAPALKLHRKERYRCIRAGNLCAGLVVPVYENGLVAEYEIVSAESEMYDGSVYDLEVPDTHNFVADGVVVHNSIYKWRGSDIKNILDFERDFPTARVITLSQNYRSTKNILHAAGVLIDHNNQRKKKPLVTDNEQGAPVTALAFETGSDEAEGIAQRIKEAVQAGRFKFRDHAVFMRINALTRSLESAFVKHGVPFQIVKGLAFFERKENRDVLAYLRLLANPQDTISFLRIVNEPSRGIGKVSLDKLQSFAADQEIGLLVAAGQVARVTEIKGKAATGLRDFHRLMTELRARMDLPPHELVQLVLEKSGYESMLKESGDPDDADRLANVGELITAAKQFWDEDNSRTVTDFLEQITLASDVDGWDEQADHVSVMTLHASKGLEFPVVYLLAVEHGLLPHERSVGNTEEEEEERRLCFVGMTRAMKELYLCSARMRERRGQINYTIPSMFLQELPREVKFVDASGRNAARSAADEYRAKLGPAAAGDWADTGAQPFLPPKPKSEIKPNIAPGSADEFEVGALVQHAEYGFGNVVEVLGRGALRKVRVRFAGHGVQVFAGAHVALKVIRRRA